MAARKRNWRLLQTAQQGTAALQGAKVTEGLQWRKYGNPRTGHGSVAEDANALSDLLRGRKVELTGRSNVKDGPDRIINGKVLIQTKYCQNAQESVNAALDGQTGLYRYKNQVLEVPKDQYAEALELMGQKIREGRVPGVTNPDEAERLVKPGSVTYRQARNIAQAGNIDSLWFDLKTQSVTAAYAFGLSFAIHYANCRWNGMESQDSLKLSLTAGLGTGSLAWGTGVLTQQFLRTAAGRGFAAFSTSVSKRVVDELYSSEAGREIIHRLASIMLGKNLTGAAAKNAAARLLRTNLVVSTVSTAALSLPDLYQALVSRTISWQQFGKNLGVSAAGVGGGTVGSWVGALVGGSIGGALGTIVVPGAGTAPGAKIGGAVGRVVGGLGGGLGSAWGAKKLLDLVVKDDGEKMFALAQQAAAELAFDYLVTEEEFAEKISPRLKERITPQWLKSMYRAGSRSEEPEQARYRFAYTELEPFFAEVIRQRPTVDLPQEKLVRREMRRTSWLLLLEYLRAQIGAWLGRGELLPG